MVEDRILQKGCMDMCVYTRTHTNLSSIYLSIIYMIDYLRNLNIKGRAVVGSEPGGTSLMQATLSHVNMEV